MKKKRHHIIVTITHDKPVNRATAVQMFRDQWCTRGCSTNYYPYSADNSCEEAWIVSAKSCPERRR